MKRQRSYNYHTKVLIPEAVAVKARAQETESERLEVIYLWQEAHRTSHHFKGGDIAYHVDDLEQKLHVDKILKTYPKPENGERQKPKIVGVSVHWHEEIPAI